MAEGSSTQLECPGCEYRTIVWEFDGHATVCPECGLEALVPEDDAKTLRANRLRENGVFRHVRAADDATDFIPMPEGSSDPSTVTMIDGEPLVEIPEQPALRGRESLLDRVDTVSPRKLWEGSHDQRTSDIEETGDLDLDDLKEMAEEVRRGSPSAPFRLDPLGDGDG